MKRRLVILAPVLLLLLLVTNSFENDYFLITKEDVALSIPQGFPEPVYDFSQNKLSPAAFVLGRKLFYDPILSKDQSTSCASCHQRISAFGHTDHQLSHGIYGMIGKRNVPALQNLIWKDAFMMDGGVNNLEVQPLNPITSPVEMDETLPHVIQKLQEDEVYAQLFKEAYGDSKVSSERLLKALAQFTGMMISSNSRYDMYSRGEATLATNELNGLKLFREHCATCHREPLFTDNTYRAIGLATDTSLADSGRMVITGVMADYMKFKVPGLRNVEMTYPYMHDGRFKNLKQVMDHYANGNFEGDADAAVKKNIGLNDADKADLIAFLKTLTDKQFLYDRRFADPNFR